MGSWGVKPFENDAAADFAVEFFEAGWPLVAKTIRRRVSREDDENQQLVAACEFVAAARGWPARGEARGEFAEWLEEHPELQVDERLTAKAVERMQTIIVKSALLEAWEDAGLAKAWVRTIQSLIARLEKPVKQKAYEKRRHKPAQRRGSQPRPMHELCSRNTGASRMRQKESGSFVVGFMNWKRCDHCWPSKMSHSWRLVTNSMKTTVGQRNTSLGLKPSRSP